VPGAETDEADYHWRIPMCGSKHRQNSPMKRKKRDCSAREEEIPEKKGGPRRIALDSEKIEEGPQLVQDKREFNQKGRKIKGVKDRLR